MKIARCKPRSSRLSRARTGCLVAFLGATVSVIYSGDTDAFVHAGGRYRVVVDWEDGNYRSNVHEAQDCGSYSGTTHVDGSAIDTADFPWLHHAALFFVLAPVISMALLTAFVWNRRRRRGRRTTVVKDD